MIFTSSILNYVRSWLNSGLIWQTGERQNGIQAACYGEIIHNPCHVFDLDQNIAEIKDLCMWLYFTSK